MENLSHQAVLLKEVVESMNIRADGHYLDATAGRGGHIAALLEKLGPDGQIFAIDRDPQAVSAVSRRFADDSRVRIMQARFSSLKDLLADGECFDGILFDFGVSSPQLDDASRGFSFQHDGPLDMRMNPDEGANAEEWLASAEMHEIRDVLRRYGEERYAHQIANAIVRARNEFTIDTTSKLVKIIEDAVPVHDRHKHPATRCFQAIRIYINAELEEITAVLPVALESLCVRGRLVAISFHSLEDRIVKRFMRDEARGDDLPKEIPVRDSERSPRLRLIGKPVKASVAEIEQNPRARSAIMRVAERMPDRREVA
jgi:16S rRNA (cytosine1402-N4)-methyltransferase